MRLQMIWFWMVACRVVASFLVGCTIPLIWGASEVLVRRLGRYQGDTSDQVGWASKVLLFISDIGSTMGGLLLCLWIGTDVRATRATLLAFLMGGVVVRRLRREI